MLIYVPRIFAGTIVLIGQLGFLLPDSAKAQPAAVEIPCSVVSKDFTR